MCHNSFCYRLKLHNVNCYSTLFYNHSHRPQTHGKLLQLIKLKSSKSISNARPWSKVQRTQNSKPTSEIHKSETKVISHDISEYAPVYVENMKKWKVGARGKKNPKNKGKCFSHLFASIFHRSLVPRMNNFRLNYMVLIKIIRIWKNKIENGTMRNTTHCDSLQL